MEDIRTTLLQLGLSEKEATVYQALLMTGPSSATTLSQRVSMPRSTTQFTCQQLVDKGIASVARKQGTLYYAPEPPEKFLALLEHERWKIDQREEYARSVMEELRHLAHPAASQPKIRFYEGKEGLSQCWDELLQGARTGDEIIGYLHPLDTEDDPLRLAPVVERYVRVRAEKGVSSRLLLPDIALSEGFRQHDAACLRTTRVMKGRKTISPTEIMLHGDRMYTRTITPSNVFASILENKDVVAMQRIAFETLWNLLDS